MQTQTSNTLHNAIMEAGGKDRLPMLAPDKEVPISEGSFVTTTEPYLENRKNVSQDIRDQLNAEAEAGESINVQDLETYLYWEFGTFTSRDDESLESYYLRFYQMMNEPSQQLKTVSYHKLYDILKQHQNEVNELRAKRIAHAANLLALVAQQQPVYHPQNHSTHYTQNSSTRSQQATTRNKGKAIFNSPQPIYDEEPSMVAEDDEMSKDREIDKLMALISLSFKKIYKPTNNNLQTSSNTSRTNQDNSPRINRGAGYDNQREKDAAYHREKLLLCKQEEAGIQLNTEQADWRDDTDDESEDQELEAHYMYMAQIQKVSPDAADSEPIFNFEPLQKVSNDDHYNVFAIESEHPEQSKSVHDTYPIEQDKHNVIIDSLDMSHDREQIDQNDDLANERELLASLIEKLKCEIDDSKNRNKLLETSNKVLVEQLKGEIDDFKSQYKSLKSSNNHFKEANNKLSETNALMYKDLKKFQAELDRRNDVEYALKEVEDHHRNVKLSKNKTSVTACNDSLNAKTLHVNIVCATCGKCVFNETHDMCVLKSRNGVNSRTKMPIAVPVSTREPKRTVKQSVAKPLRKIVASETNNQKPRNITSKLYKRVSKACSWWYAKFTPLGYKWKPMSKIGNVNQNVSMPLGNASRTTNILEPMTPRRSTVSKTTLHSNSFAARRDCPIHHRLWVLKAHDGKSGNLKLLINFVEKFLGTVKFGNDQIAPILSYGDLNDIVIGLPKLKFVKDHLCSSYELGKAKRKSFYQHMDLCGPMRVASINGKKYILVIVDDYSRYTWTYFLRSKDETPKVLINFLRLVQRGLHV
nr:hypothetical protein [Tanacetum cinerariifolium]